MDPDRQRPSKIAVVGAGSVGATIAYACLIRAAAKTVALSDLNASKTRAEVLDLNHGGRVVGIVSLDSDGATEAERHAATVIAGAQPGVVEVRVTHEH